MTNFVKGIMDGISKYNSWNKIQNILEGTSGSKIKREVELALTTIEKRILRLNNISKESGSPIRLSLVVKNSDRKELNARKSEIGIEGTFDVYEESGKVIAFSVDKEYVELLMRK